MKIISEKGFPQDLSDLESSSSSDLDVDTKTCAHLRVVKGMCWVCKSEVFKYIDKDLWLSPDEIAGIRMRYYFFDARNDIVSLSAMNNDEGETTGVLATILKKLKLIHRLFFNPKFKGGLAHRDVKLILDRLKVLQGCKLSFEGIFPSDFEPQNSRLWMMAEELGAICSTSVFTSRTHVVTLVATEEESRQAELDGIILVHPAWLHSCYELAKRFPEADYPIKLKNKKLRSS
nr:rna polymerase ii c-terminal domain phosphatase-like 4 [Quercus suber]